MGQEDGGERGHSEEQGSHRGLAGLRTGEEPECSHIAGQGLGHRLELGCIHIWEPACKGLELVGSEVLEHGGVLGHGGVLERGVLPLHGGQLLRGGQLDGGLERGARLPGWT